MAEDFESNATASLRNRIAAGSPSFAKAAAQVSIYCMDEAYGNRLENALLASCEIFDDFDPESHQDVANLVSLKFSQNMRAIARVDPVALLKVLSVAAPSTYVANCLGGLIARLNPEDIDPGRRILDALIEYRPLLVESADWEPIRTYTAALARGLPVADLGKQIKALVDSPLDATAYNGFFGHRFLEGVAEATSAAKPDEIPASYADDLVALFALVEPFGLAGWQEGFFDCCTELLNSQTWPLHEVGLSILRAHEQELTAASAAKALAALFEAGNAATAEDNLEHHEQLQGFAHGIALRAGRLPFLPDTLKGGINKYLASSAISESAAVRATIPGFLRSLVPVLGKNYFDASSDELITLIPTKSPAPEALDALRALAISASETLDAKVAALYEAISLPVRQVATSEAAAFGADSLIQALEQPDSASVRNVAESYLPALFALVVPAYAPANLAQVARVLDSAALYLNGKSEQYVTNLVALINSASTPHVIFAIARLNRLAKSGSVPAASIPLVAQALVSMWTYISTTEGKEEAARMLLGWHERIPEGSRLTFWNHQIDFMDNSPKLAWDNISASWELLPVTAQTQAILRGYPHEEIRDKILGDLSDARHKLSASSAGEIILRVREGLGDAAADRITSSVVAMFDRDEKDEVSRILFGHLRKQPEKLNQKTLTSLASSLAGSISEEGLGYFLELLQGDKDLKEYAFNSLPAYLDGKGLDAKQAEQLALTFAAGLDSANDELVLPNIQSATRYGIHMQAAYKDALGRKRKQLTGSKDNLNKEILRAIRSASRK